MPETIKIWTKQQETKERAKMQGEINRNSQCLHTHTHTQKELKMQNILSGTTELTGNDTPYICIIHV